MAAYERMVRSVTTVRYMIELPTNWAEVGKVYAAIRNELGDDRANWDDAVTVTADDEHVIFSFDETVEDKVG